MSLLRIFSSVAFALLIAACASTGPAQRPRIVGIPPYEGPVNQDALLERVFFSRFESLTGEAEISIYDNGVSRGRFKGVLVYRTPGLIRLRAFDPFGDTVLDLYKHGSLMQLYLPMHNTLYEGQTPPIGHPPGAEFGIGETSRGYRLEVRRPRPEGEPSQLYATYDFDREYLYNTDMAVYVGGREFMGMGMEGLLGGRAPEAIRMSLPGGYALEVRMVDVALDEPVPVMAEEPIPHGRKRVESIWELLPRSAID